MKTCPVCQKVLTDQAKFCYFCGASLLDPAPAPVEPEAAPKEIIAAPAEAPTVVEAVEETVEAPVVEAVEETVEAPVELPETPEPAPEPAPVVTPVPEPEPVVTPVPEAPKAEPVPVITPAPEAPKAEPAPVVTPAPEAPKAEPTVLATDSRSLMTTAGYIFTTILFHIPVIGLIFMLVWGCGKTKNISRKRFSLACLIVRLLYYILVLACTVFMLICFSGKFPALWNAVQPILFP